MALYKECGHIEGLCPCIKCNELYYGRCRGCLEAWDEKQVVDTDKLCKAAKEYCESGRDDDDLHQKGEMI